MVDYISSESKFPIQQQQLQFEPTTSQTSSISDGQQNTSLKKINITMGLRKRKTLNPPQPLVEKPAEYFQRTQQAIEVSKIEIHSRFDKIFSLFVEKIFMNVFRLAYYILYAIIYIVAWPIILITAYLRCVKYRLCVKRKCCTHQKQVNEEKIKNEQTIRKQLRLMQ